MDLLAVKSREKKNAVICVFKLSGAAWEGGRGFSVALNIFLYCEKCSMFLCLHVNQGGEMNNRVLVIGSIRRTCGWSLQVYFFQSGATAADSTDELVLWSQNKHVDSSISASRRLFGCFLSGCHFPAPDRDASRRGEVRSAASDGRPSRRCRQLSTRLAEAFVALAGWRWERSSAPSEWFRPSLLKKLSLMRGWTVAGQDVSTRSPASGSRRPLLEAAAHVSFFVSCQVTLPTPGCVPLLYWWYTVHYNALNVCVCVCKWTFIPV